MDRGVWRAAVRGYTQFLFLVLALNSKELLRFFNLIFDLYADAVSHWGKLHFWSQTDLANSLLHLPPMWSLENDLWPVNLTRGSEEIQ